MKFEYNDVVVLQQTHRVSSKDFVGRIFGYDGWGSDRLKLIPLSDKHELYVHYPKDYIVKSCGFDVETFVDKVKTALIQTLLEGSAYEI